MVRKGRDEEAIMLLMIHEGCSQRNLVVGREQEAGLAIVKLALTARKGKSRSNQEVQDAHNL